MTNMMHDMTAQRAPAKRRHPLNRGDDVYLFFFGRTDLTSFGIQCMGCGRARRAFRMRQLIRRQVLFHYGCVFIAKGEGFFESAHQSRTTVRENQAMLFFPGDWHSYGCGPEGDWLEYWVVFDGLAVRQAHQEGLLSEEHPLLQPEDPRAVRKLFESCVGAAQSPSQRRQERLPGLIHRVLDELLPPHTPQLSSVAADAVSHVQQVILEDPAADLDFRELASRNGVSYSLLRQRFKQATGTSLVSYHNQARMNLACTYLAEGHSVKETALLVGIDDPYYFSRLFRRATSASPTAFIRQLQP
jgi:AraC family transcriptional regulator of arabinose operon